MGKLLITAGLALIMLGVLIQTGLLNWFGRLPGDIKYEGQNSVIFFPWVSMLVISLVATVVLNLLGRR
ncbi:MAG: DUF2905 domain-containing protein [Candidatus Dadabacteria bacterium]|nr:MAG: DUF2905 domain-containing protein [Candidatus Dadabacteria bacterium]